MLYCLWAFPGIFFFRCILSFVLEDFRRAGVIHDCLSTFLGDILIDFFSGENVSKAHLSVSINLVLASFTLRFSRLFVQFMVLRWLAIICI